MAKKLIEMQSIVQKRKKNTVSGKRKEETILGHDIWRKIKPLLPPPLRATLEGCVECTPLQNKISRLFCLCSVIVLNSFMIYRVSRQRHRRLKISSGYVKTITQRLLTGNRSILSSCCVKKLCTTLLKQENRAR